MYAPENKRERRMADKVVTGLYLFIYFFKGVKEVNHSQTCPNQKRVESKKKM